MVKVKTSTKLLQEQEIILISYICHTAVINAKILQKQNVNNLKTQKKDPFKIFTNTLVFEV